MAAAHVFVADLDRPTMSEDDHHHLARVLRLRAGESVTASDGEGRWRPCTFDDGPFLSVQGDVVVETPLSPAVTVAFSLMKGERPEWTVQKLTEVGVDRIVPVIADRSVVRMDAERAARQVRRWQKVAREASMQSRRMWLPVVEAVTDVASVVGTFGGAGQLAVATAGGGPPSLERPAVLVGPEGGWSEAELALAAGVPEVGLGPTVLRAETAAVAAAVLLCALRWGLPGTKDANG